jgi:hypothetical protein
MGRRRRYRRDASRATGANAADDPSVNKVVKGLTDRGSFAGATVRSLCGSSKI